MAMKEEQRTARGKIANPRGLPISKRFRCRSGRQRHRLQELQGRLVRFPARRIFRLC